MKRTVLLVSLCLATTLPVLLAGAGRAQTPVPGPQIGTDRGRGPAPQTGTGLILGQVVDAASGQPLSDVVVSPGRAGGPPRMSAPGTLANTRDNFQPVITGADGRFVFRDLPRGSYRITATLSGYVDGGTGQSRPGGDLRPITLADDERRGGVKIRLWKYAAVSGTVVDEAGEPAARLQVRAFRRAMVAGRLQFQATGLGGFTSLTDDHGRYRIDQLTPGDYVVSIPQTQTTMPSAVMDSLVQAMVNNAAGPPDAFIDLIMSGSSLGALASGVRVGDLMWGGSYIGSPSPPATGRAFGYQTMFFPGVAQMAQATAITLGSGDTRSGVDFALQLVPMSRISGSVTGPDGPIANMMVRLQPTGPDGPAAGGNLDTASAVTRGDGTFVMVGVPSGDYVMSAVKRPRPAEFANAMAAVLGNTPPPEAKPAPTLAAELPVSVGRADATGLSLILREGAHLSGRVEFNGTSAQPTPEELKAITISLSPVAGSTGLGGMLMEMAGAHPDESGQFKTAGYEPGRYFVTAGANGPGGGLMAGLTAARQGGAPTGQWSVKSAMAGGRDLLNEALDLKDTDISGVVVTFTFADHPINLSGAVHGEGLATATVIVFPADYRAWIAGGMVKDRSQTAVPGPTGTSAAAPGTYRFSIRPGEYFVAAINESDLPDIQDAAFFGALARVASRVTVADGDRKVQDLEIVKVIR